MAAEPESQEVRDLLRRTATVPSTGPDVGAIRGRIRRRRRVRHGAAGLAAVVLLAGGAALAIDGDDGGTEVQVVEQPETTDTTVAEPPADDEPTDLDSLGALAPEGIAIQTATGVELRALDGTLLHTLEGYELATEDREDGLVSTVTNVVPLRAPDGSLQWFDPASGLATVVGPDGGAPLWNGLEVGVDEERGIRAVGDAAGGWFATSSWRLSSDHRVVSVPGRGIYDSSSQSSMTYMPTCWLAARHEDADAVVCEDEGETTVTLLRAGSGDGVLVPDGNDGEPRVATAAWIVGEEVLVRTEQARCHAADAMVLRDGEASWLLGPNQQANVSSAAIGVSDDGRAIVQLNGAACDASAPPEELGVYLIDLRSGERELIWAGGLMHHEVRAWTSLPLTESPAEPTATSIPGEPVDMADLETVTPEEIGRDLLLFGSDGITRLVDGERRRVWDQPVERAADTGGASGTILQEAPGRAILRTVGEPSVPVQEVVAAEDGLRLVGFLPFDEDEQPQEPPHGRPEGRAWYLREDRHGSDDVAESTWTLHRTYPGPGGEEQLIGDIGESWSNLDGIARVGEDRTLFSTCHIQCAIRTALDEPDPIVLPHWLGGLDGSAELWAYVRFDVPDIAGRPTAPVLTVHDGDDDVVAQVRLPDEIGWETYVDLSHDGTAALVWSRDWQTGDLTGPVLVDALDTAEPRVRAVASGGQAVRFVE